MLWLIYTRHWRRIQAVIPFALVIIYFGYVFWLGSRLNIADRFVRYAVACVVVQSVALILITCALLASKVIGAQKQERRRAIDMQIGALLATYVTESGDGSQEQQLLELAKQHPDEFLGKFLARPERGIRGSDPTPLYANGLGGHPSISSQERKPQSRFTRDLPA